MVPIFHDKLFSSRFAINFSFWLLHKVAGPIMASPAMRVVSPSLLPSERVAGPDISEASELALPLT